MKKKILSFRVSKETTLAQAGQIAAKAASDENMKSFAIQFGMHPGQKNESGDFIGSDIELGLVTIIVREK